MGNKNISPNNDIVVLFIKENYSPIGDPDSKDYATSADIAQDISEMAYVSIPEIYSLMTSAGFKIEFISGKPYWLVFKKNDK